MSKDSSQGPFENRHANQMLLRNALATMSREQLVDLRSTAHRLKHLPFTRLVEVLFTEAARDPAHTEQAPQQHNFAGESAEDCRSAFLRDLFEEIERALTARSQPDEDHPGDEGIH